MESHFSNLLGREILENSISAKELDGMIMDDVQSVYYQGKCVRKMAVSRTTMKQRTMSLFDACVR